MITGGYECFHCGTRAVIWDNDFSYEDYCLDGDGIVHCCHCMNCGAYIEYFVPIEPYDPEDTDEQIH